MPRLKPLWKHFRYAKVRYKSTTRANVYHILAPEWMDNRVFDYYITLCGTLTDNEFVFDKNKKPEYIVLRRPVRGRKLCRFCKINYRKLIKLIGEEDAYFSELIPAKTDAWKRNCLAIRAGRFTRKSGSRIKEVRNVFRDGERARCLMGRLSGGT